MVWLYNSLFIYLLIDIWVVSSFLIIMNKVAMNIYLQISMWSYVFFFLDKYLWSGIAACIVNIVYV